MVVNVFLSWIQSTGFVLIGDWNFYVEYALRRTLGSYSNASQ